jgi:hypothetical protein
MCRRYPADVVRAGGMNDLFGGVYAAATLGIFLREFTHGHTRQLAAVLRRHLVALVGRTTLLRGIDQRCFVDIDSLLRPVYGRAKQGASFGHTKIAGKTVRHCCIKPSRDLDAADFPSRGSRRATRPPSVAGEPIQ